MLDRERALLDVTQAERAVMMKLGVATPHLHIHIYPVSESLTREEIVEIIDARNKQPYDAVFVRALRNRLDRVLSTE